MKAAAAALFFALLAVPHAAGVSAQTANLIPNPNLEQAGSSAGTPASWHKGGYGTNSRTLSYPVPGFSGNGISVQVSGYQSGDAKWYFTPISIDGGTQYRFTNRYKATASSIVTVEYEMSDGSRAWKDIAFANPASSFTSLSAEFTAPEGARKLTIYHLLKSNGSLTTDSYELIEVSTTPPANGTVPNGTFEEGTDVPAFWNPGKWGTNSPTFTYPVAGSGGGKAAKITMQNRVSGDAKWRTAPIPLSPGDYVYRNEYQSDVLTYVTVQFHHTDGSLTYKDIAAPEPATGWTPLSAHFTVPPSVRAVIVFHLINKNGSLTIDNVEIERQGRPGIFTTGAVTIRFDDNWLSQYVYGFPKLDQYGFKGTLYVISTRQRENGFPGYMSRAEIEEVYANGHEIGAHTRTHTALATLSRDAQWSDIHGSRQDLLSWDVGPVFSFSYPFGSYTEETVELVKDAGFTSAASSNGGDATPSSNPFILERRGLENTTTLTQARSWIDNAVANKTWLILAVHQIADTCSVRYCVTTAVYNGVIDYLAQKDVPVVTVSEGRESLE